MTEVKPLQQKGMSGMDWNFGMAALVYVGTGILQPMVIDYLKGYCALGRKVLLLPTLANIIGMALCGLLVSKTEWKEFWAGLPTKQRNVIGLAACIDWFSGMLCTGGLLLTGGAIFVILYNSCPAWTALLSWLVLNKTLTQSQMVGIGLVILGLIANVWGNTTSSSNSNSVIVMGSMVVLAGSFMHSAMFVVSDYALNSTTSTASTVKISPTIWSCCLGCLESVVMILWVAGHVYHNGFHDPDQPQQQQSSSFVWMGFIGLVIIDALHAVSFFALLSKLGAVGSALIKGVQTIIVVVLSGIFFCSPTSPQQCLTPSKVMSMSIVLLGVLSFAFGNKKPKPKAKMSPAPSFDDSQKQKKDKEETKSLLSKK